MDGLVPMPVVPTASMPTGTKDDGRVYCTYKEAYCDVITDLAKVGGCKNCVANTDNAATFSDLEALSKVSSSV